LSFSNPHTVYTPTYICGTSAPSLGDDYYYPVHILTYTSVLDAILQFHCTPHVFFQCFTLLNVLRPCSKFQLDSEFLILLNIICDK